MKIFIAALAIIIMVTLSFNPLNKMEVTWNDTTAWVRISNTCYEYPRDDGNGIETTWNDTTAWVRIGENIYIFETN